jgi:hypothetical protein
VLSIEETDKALAVVVTDDSGKEQVLHPWVR